MDQKQVFQEAFLKYKSDNKINDLFNKIKDLDYKTYLWYFLMAMYFKTKSDYNEAAKYISNAIKELATIDLNPNLIGDHLENSWLAKEGKIRLPTAEYQHLKDIAHRVYQLAGEIFATQGNFEQSLAAYENMQYLSCLLESKIDLNLNSVIVYSFRRINEYSLADIINNEITVVHPSKMNDPFDSIANLWSSPEVLKKTCTNQKHIEMLSKSFESYRIRSFVANETYDSDDSILRSILMWSHYTDGHTGYCIKYKLSKNFIKKNPKNTFGETDYHHYISPVTYSSGEDLNLLKRSITSDEAYIRKNDSWKYENETRLICYNAQIKDPFWGIPLDKDSQIEAIYLGYNTSTKNIKLIKNILENNPSYQDVKLYKMNVDIDINIYNLIPQEIALRNKIE